MVTVKYDWSLQKNLSFYMFLEKQYFFGNNWVKFYTSINLRSNTSTY